MQPEMISWPVRNGFECVSSDTVRVMALITAQWHNNSRECIIVGMLQQGTSKKKKIKQEPEGLKFNQTSRQCALVYTPFWG